MILIADSGSTKADWALVDSGGVKEFKTRGMNPVLTSGECIVELLRQELLPVLPPVGVESLFFYGAGCRDDQLPKMQSAFGAAFAGRGHVACHFYSDMLGAARALCGTSEGIAGILGTGANSCLFDGREMVRKTTALGYVLGDEGSGAVLGRNFLNALYQGRLGQALLSDFETTTGWQLPYILNKVYREPQANRFLASLSPYISAHLDNEVLRGLVVDNFREFFRRSICPYGRKDLPVNVVGSIGYHYQPLLAEAAMAEGFVLGIVLKSPLRALVDYHLSNSSH